MTSPLSAMAALALMCVATTAGFAQTTAAPIPDKTMADPALFAATHQAETDWLATGYLNHTVFGAKDEKLGKVIDILFDANGKPLAVIVAVGGFLGIGEKNIAIAFPAMKVVSKNGAKELHLDVTTAQLKGATRFVPYKPPKT